LRNSEGDAASRELVHRLVEYLPGAGSPDLPDDLVRTDGYHHCLNPRVKVDLAYWTAQLREASSTREKDTRSASGKRRKIGSDWLEQLVPLNYNP
jgi:hypothetical protein